MPANYSGFDVTHTTYKIVQNTEIKATVFVPHDIPVDSPRPLIVRWHGGYWVTGNRDQPLWFPAWLLELACKQGAVIVSADYRLLPEASGSELLSDIASFMHWLPQIEAHLAPFNVKPDLARTLVVGESAGGWCAIETALLHGSGLHGFPNGSSPVKIRTAISSYGVLDLKTPFYTEVYEKKIMGTPMLPVDTYDSVFNAAKSEPKRILTGLEVPERMPFAACAVQQGKTGELMGPEAEKYPMEVLDMVATAPAIWAYHGLDDTAVPYTATTAFMDKLQKTVPGVPARTTLQPGEHGLDGEASITEGWMGEGIAWVEQHWLG